ncbi:Envelope glycoprotein [Gossypium arboreum]|uniref:Envelope glycoprotein n=1 Tax=Gossypium arboreum TaxID=29729 RepID=A0A0B0P1R5_GOSAR|nr:Envelope glycoprotein [Gossypium arboreum]
MGSFKEKFNGDLDEYVKDEKEVVMCKWAQVYSTSSGWRSSEILSNYQAIIWGIS